MQSAGERFKKIRQELSLTQAEFGQKLGLTSQGISNIENDKSFLTLDKMQLLENFNINMNYLIYGSGGIFINTAAYTADKTETNFSEEKIEKLMIKLLKKHGIMPQL